jgi:hypothetical protein
MKIGQLLFALLIFAFSSCAVIRNKMTSQTFDTSFGSETELKYSPIYWQTNTFNKTTIEKSSFVVSVKLQDIEKPLFMQFDLGANRSMLYGNTLSALCEKYPTLRDDTIKKENYSIFNNAKIEINDSHILTANRLYVKKDFGQSKIDTNYIIIGTLGYDILGDNILILDFKSNRFAISESIPAEMESKACFIDHADLNKFPIILPFRLGKKKIRLFYDTGSSMFPILTGTNRLKKLSKQRKIKEVDFVSSWGKEVLIFKPVETKNKVGNLVIGNIDLGKVEIFGQKKLNNLSYAGSYLYGFTGNVIFDKKILIINRKDNSFGILK